MGVALAQDADRITRGPGHRTFLDDEFERLGSRLVALDDWGDNTHEGELLKFLEDWVSKGERLKIAKRSRRGMLRKAREGKVILPPIPDYVSWPWKLWIAVAGTLLVIGGLAWISKLWVIVATGAARATGDRVRAASAVSTRLYWGPAGVRSRPWAFPGPTTSKRTSLAEPTIVAKNVSPLRCVLWP